MDVKERCIASMLGFAIGDAMGATTEFMDKSAIAKKYGRVTEIIGGGWLNLTPGEVTDDTQLMLCVARASNSRSFLAQCCIEFSDWYMSNPKDIGGTCRSIMQRCHGVDKPMFWLQTSQTLQKERASHGNGSLMRALYPVLQGNLTNAMNQGGLTHNNRVCDEAIAEYYKVFSEILLTGSLNPKEYSYIKHCEPTGMVISTLFNAIYWVTHTSSFSEAVISAVNDGGDADTIAAITGSIAGALYGLNDLDGVPSKLVKQLSKNVVEEILKLSGGLYDE